MNHPSKNLSLLLALSSNPNNTATVPSSDPDPAISGAKKVGPTVQLGFDATIAPTVQWAAELKVALNNAADDFAALQGDVRNYGAAKRQAYNTTYGASVVTVKIPYLVAGEEKFCAVTCSNRYAVDQEMVLGSKEKFGSAYPKLFVETTQKTLKPDMEVLLKGILTDAGLKAAQVDAAMETLFEVSKRVSTTEVYEQESKLVTDDLKEILGQACKRAAPSLKF